MPSFSSLVSALALAASALAYTTPTAFNATSNPVYTPNTGDIVPVGKPYKITWGPTESGTVSIILLRGPGSNILPLYPIVEKIKNTGSYTWTPKKDLEDDVTEYGLQIIIDSNGQYQYSTQFGISNPNYVPDDDATTTLTSYETSSTTIKSYSTSFITVTTAPPSYNTTIPTYTPPPSYNTTITYAPPTATETEAPEETTSTPAAPSQTGAASSIKVASGFLVGVAGVAALLF